MKNTKKLLAIGLITPIAISGSVFADDHGNEEKSQMSPEVTSYTEGINALETLRFFDAWENNFWNSLERFENILRQKRPESYTAPQSAYTQGFPRVNLYEKDQTLFIEANIPDFDKKQITIKIEGQKLSLQGIKPLQPKDPSIVYFYQEKEVPHFYREIILPSKVDKENAEAKLEEGVLRLALPKVEDKETPEDALIIQ